MANKVRKYRNLGQLLDFHGAETPYSFGRGLYKYTACGPWTAFVLRKEPARDEVEEFVVACDPISNRAKVESGNPSADTLQMIGLDDPAGEAANWAWREYCGKLDAFVKESRTVERGHAPKAKVSITKKSIVRRWFRVERHVPEQTRDFYYEDGGTFDYSECIGLRIGSIVEGSDVEVDPVFLRFPFTEEELDEAVTGIDDEASFYWERDNSRWYSLNGPDAMYGFRETWGECEWDGEPPANVKEAAEKWAKDGNETSECGEQIPLPGAEGWTVSEYVNDGIF